MIIYFIKIWKLYLYCIPYFVLFLIMFYSIVFFPPILFRNTIYYLQAKNSFLFSF